MVHGNTAYFSRDYRVYSFTLPEDKWTTLPRCQNRDFSLAVVYDKLTTIGGCYDGVATNVLLCLSKGSYEKEFPLMPTKVIKPAVITTHTHLVVAGGKNGGALSTVQLLDLNTLQWFSAKRSPEALWYPHMTLCGGYLYLSEDSSIFSCSMEELLKSCKPPSTKGSVWTRLTDIPVPYGASLATLRGHVLAIGGSEEKYGGNPTGAIHCYNRNTNSWNVIGEMPTPRSRTLVAVLSQDELIVVGGIDEKTNEIAFNF